MFIDITNREQLNTLLDSLDESAEPQWGLLKPQHMVEHLGTAMQISNGKKPLGQRVSDEQAKIAKEKFIYTDVEMEKGLKTPTLPEIPGPFIYPTMEDARKELISQLDDFEQYFRQNVGASLIHPRLGFLGYEEWVVFHNKHFTHHFKQFGLL